MLMVHCGSYAQYLVRVTAYVTVYHKVGQQLICHRVHFVFDHAQDVKPAQGQALHGSCPLVHSPPDQCHILFCRPCH